MKETCPRGSGFPKAAMFGSVRPMRSQKLMEIQSCVWWTAVQPRRVCISCRRTRFDPNLNQEIPSEMTWRALIYLQLSRSIKYLSYLELFNVFSCSTAVLSWDPPILGISARDSNKGSGSVCRNAQSGPGNRCDMTSIPLHNLYHICIYIYNIYIYVYNIYIYYIYIYVYNIYIYILYTRGFQNLWNRRYLGKQFFVFRDNTMFCILYVFQSSCTYRLIYKHA